MNKRLVILDWNGTLQDDFHHIYECGVQRIFRHFKLPCPTKDEYRNEVTADFMGSLYWPRGVPRDVTSKELNDIMKEGFKEKGRPAKLFPEARQAVVSLANRDVTLAVVSGYDSALLHEAIVRNDLDYLLARIYGQVSSTGKQPYFRKLLEEFDCLPKEAVSVGDTVEDIQAAAELGIKPLAYPHGFHSRDRLMEECQRLPQAVIIDSLTEILNHLD